MMKHTVLLLLLGGSLAAAEFPVYPSAGGLNLRVPVIAPVDGGAKGRSVPFEAVRFSYDLAPHLTGLGEGKVVFFLKDSMRRSAKEVLTLSGPAGALKVTIPAAASSARRIRLQAGSAVTDSAILPTVSQWQLLTLLWGVGKAELRLPNGAGLTVALPPGFDVTRISCEASLVDEVELTGNGGRFVLDWEQEYAARLTPAGDGGRSVALHGFDTFVIGNDPAKRDYPYIQLTNSTAREHEFALQYTMTSEVNRLRHSWREKHLAAPGTSLLTPVKFPVPLPDDVYHLTVSIDGQGWKKHFLYAGRRTEKPGPGLFGLHDSNVGSFGFWPEALPLRYAHKYLRWGWIQGPMFVDRTDAPERDPAAPPEEWTWNAALDWELLAGRELFVSLQSYPYSSWHREREYEKGMKIWPSGKGGGFPKLGLYARFLQESAKRYRGKIRHYEIENEPNAYGMPDHPEDYAEICRTVYRTVKKVDPQAMIYGVCGTGSFIPWMTCALKTGATGNFDILSYHTYTTPRQPDQANLRQFLDEVKQAAPAGIRRFNSETGVLQAFRYQAEEAIPAATVAAAVAERRRGFVSNAPWPGRVNDEWEAAGSIVKNAVINLASGSEGFIFFGWNPEWPKNDRPWTEKEADFSLLSITPGGERTPSLLCLAVAVLTTQLESADPGKPYRFLDSGELCGTLFRKAAGGQTAVVWSAGAAADVLIAAPTDEIQAVTLLGEPRTFKAISTTADGRKLFLLPLTTMPLYLHLSDGAMQILSSPISAVEVENIVDGNGSLALTLLNTGDQVWNARIRVGEVSGLEVSPPEQDVAIPAKRRRKMQFRCRPVAGRKATEFQVPVTLTLPGGVELRHSYRIGVSPSGRAGVLPEGFKLADHTSLDAFAPEFRLDRAEQAVFGRPSELASIQEAHFWAGPQELSGSFRLGCNREALFITGRIRDIRPRLPKVWPGVLGSSVELFLDFRTPAEGLGRAQYDAGVCQFMIRPPLGGQPAPALWCPQRRELTSEDIRLVGGQLSAEEYWIGVTIPWKLFGTGGGMPERFGFDVGVNGSFGDRDERKTQLMLFGTAQNFRDASKFGLFLPIRQEVEK